MAAEAQKWIFCHACEESSAVQHDVLVCPRCGDDFIEETAAGGSVEDGGGADLMYGMPQHPLVALLARLVQLRAQVAGAGEHDSLLPLLAQLQALGGGAGDVMVGNAGDYVDDGRFDELLQTLFNEEGSQLTPATEAIIARLEASVKTMAESGVSDGSPCSVCQSVIQPTDNVLALECKHCFHPECLVPWLKQSSTCPVCRWNVNDAAAAE